MQKPYSAEILLKPLPKPSFFKKRAFRLFILIGLLTLFLGLGYSKNKLFKLENVVALWTFSKQEPLKENPLFIGVGSISIEQEDPVIIDEALLSPLIQEDEDPLFFPDTGMEIKESFYTPSITHPIDPSLQIQNTLAGIEIRGVRLNAEHSRVLIHQRSYEVGEMLPTVPPLRIMAIRKKAVVFSDEAGNTYTKLF